MKRFSNLVLSLFLFSDSLRNNVGIKKFYLHVLSVTLLWTFSYILSYFATNSFGNFLNVDNTAEAKKFSFYAFVFLTLPLSIYVYIFANLSKKNGLDISSVNLIYEPEKFLKNESICKAQKKLKRNSILIIVLSPLTSLFVVGADLYLGSFAQPFRLYLEIFLFTAMIPIFYLAVGLMCLIFLQIKFGYFNTIYKDFTHV